MAKHSLILGCTGQIGRYLSELLISKGYKVYGLIRRTSTSSTSRINHLLNNIELIDGDITDEYSLIKSLEKSEPDEVYNLAAQSYVPSSWSQPILTSEITALGVAKILSAIKIVNEKIKFFQASSSEMYGKVKEIPQTENTPFHPRSMYAVSKCYGFWTTVNYRESYGMFASNGILFNNESPARDISFVTRKITLGIKKILNGETKELRLGNTKARRDWGFTGDYVKAIYAILQHDKPDDFVVATGETHSVEEFLEIAFGYCNLDWRDYVVIDPELIRPAEVDILLGDNTKIKNTLGWYPEIKFHELVEIMIKHDLQDHI